MPTTKAATSPADQGQSGTEPPQGWVGPELPGLLQLLIGFALFMTGGTLILTLLGAPIGIPMFVAGLGLMLTPKERLPASRDS